MNVLSIHCNRLEHLENRIVKLGFSRGEFYNFLPEQLPILRQFIQDRDITPSVHCPLRRAPWYPYPVTWSFLSTDVHHEERELSFKLIKESLRDAVDIGAAYVVVHYPTPASLQAHEMPFEVQHDIAWNSAHRLQELSVTYGIPIYIEGFGPSPFMDLDFIISVLRAFPSLRYCFDTGHLVLMAQRDGLDYFEFLEDLAPYLGCVHVWSTRGVVDYKAYHHLPPHPDLKPSDGWVDLERVVTTVRQASPSAIFVLEYSTDLPAEFGLDQKEGIDWFKDLVNAAEPETSQQIRSSVRLRGNKSDRHTRNIVLSGFMGVGKTRVGQVVAAQLGRPFIDMDDVLEKYFGMSIPAVFETQGETIFRQQESLLAQELAQGEGLVISTGGGALVSEANRRAFEHNGLLVCLQCDLDEIVCRVSKAKNRPMLEGDNLRTRIAALLEKRKPAYEAIPHQIDTTRLTIDQVAEVVVDLWRAEHGEDDHQTAQRQPE
jgi:shikimate kinase